MFNTREKNLSLAFSISAIHMHVKLKKNGITKINSLHIELVVMMMMMRKERSKSEMRSSITHYDVIFNIDFSRFNWSMKQRRFFVFAEYDINASFSSAPHRPRPNSIHSRSLWRQSASIVAFFTAFLFLFISPSKWSFNFNSSSFTSVKGKASCENLLTFLSVDVSWHWEYEFSIFSRVLSVQWKLLNNVLVAFSAEYRKLSR